MKNKKGYYRFADIGMFFLCFVIIAIGIAIGIYIFYSNTIDIREQEAKILYDKLVNTVVDNTNNNLNNKVLNDDFDIFKEAILDKNVINENYYFKIEIFEAGNEKIVKKIEEGNRDFGVECFLRSKKFPKCYPEKGEKVLILDNYNVKILTASNQLGES